MAGTDPSPRAFSLDDARTVLQHTPAVLVALLGALPDTMLSADEGPGTWSPLHVLRHLVWCEVDDWIPRVRVIRAHGTAEVFRPFDREEGFHRYANWQAPRLLDEFSRLRTANLLEIDQLSLGETDVAAEGRHPQFGRVTLEQLLATWMTHDLAHLTQVARVLTKDSGRHVGPWRAYFSLLQDGSR